MSNGLGVINVAVHIRRYGSSVSPEQLPECKCVLQLSYHAAQAQLLLLA